ncbi:MAG: trehalose-phosphatase [Ignavibacteria bacterium]|nr:trehalose-phosphatase [Ignavibacteria bacterium]
MKVLTPGTHLTTFFRTLTEAPQSALMLDYDGTLAPFTVKRDEAAPYPGIRERLRRLLELQNTRVVLISGRAIADLVPLLDLHPAPEIWGSHGWERLSAQGEYIPPTLDDVMKEGLRKAEEAGRHIVDTSYQERKPVSLALHWRGRPGATRKKIRSSVLPLWTSIASSSGLEVHEFDGGVELRATGRTKGHAVETILTELPAGSVTAVLGDDATDEDAFRALGSRGLRVLVRGEQRPTHADLLITPPEELLFFLDQWIAHVPV